MRTSRALTLCCCLAVLPLFGCANGASVGTPPQAADAPGPAPGYAVRAAYHPTAPVSPRVYAASGAPAAILVMMPGSGDVWPADPAAWAQGLDVVAPTIDPHQLAADPQAVFEQLMAQARAMANAPIWLVGPSPAIEAAMAGAPPSGPGRVSGVVMTSVASGTRSCSETMTYTLSGNGAAPQVRVEKSGNACPPGSPFGVETNQRVAPMAPAAKPSHPPRLIEASAPTSGSPASRRAALRQIAGLIKAAPSS
jgi:hypothetical protein